MDNSIKFIEAPKIDSKVLWEMSNDDFNSWRKINDYPRIISFLKLRLPMFVEWMINQCITDEILIEHTPSKFLKEIDKIYIYSVKKSDFEEEIILEKNYKMGELLYSQFLVKDKKEIVPYQSWYYSKSKTNEVLPLRNRTYIGRKIYLMNELELLDLGNLNLNNLNFENSNSIKNWCLNLDFVNLDNLNIKQILSANTLRIWFSSAKNISIEGDFHFVDAYNSLFYDMSSPKKTNLKLLNGSYQRWSIVDCEFDFNVTNSNISGWNFEGLDFFATLINSDISDSNFKFTKVKYKYYYRRAKEMHSTLKRLYSQIGKRKEASGHFYLEKEYERKSYFWAKQNFGKEYRDIKKNKFLLIPFFYFKYFIKYILSAFFNFLWGYGEKPNRVFRLSFLLILFCTILFYFYPTSSIETKGNLVNSIYFSIVTFTTLGYGDISQDDSFLKIISAIEALLGLSFWGILIAGFSNNSKDY